MGRIGLLCHGSNLHRFGIGSNGLGSTLKNAKFKGDNILISTQVHSTQFDLSQFDLSYSTKRVDLILFDLFHSTHFMQSPTALEAEAGKIEKYRELRDNGYIFHPVGLEVQGSLGESSEIFITRLCKMLCRSHNDQAGSFLKGWAEIGRRNGIENQS